jgi:hypothetical protein
VEPDELALVRETAYRTLSERTPVGVVAALGELGFFDFAEVDPIAAWSTLFDTQGQHCLTSPALDLTVLAACGLEPTRPSAVVYPTLGRGSTPPATLAGGRVAVDGLTLAGVERAETLLVGASDGDDGVKFVEIAADAAGLRLEALPGLDPDLGLVAVTGEATPSVVSHVDWASAMSRASRSVAQELVGVSDGLLRMAVEHVGQREQFGAPIAVFQAVKHRLADVHVAIVAARAALDVAWREDDPLTSQLAKALAGRAATLAARHCQQVCGGMGFTWEFGLHRWVRRGMMLDSFLGSSRELLGELGRSLVDAGEVPRLGRLDAASRAC